MKKIFRTFFITLFAFVLFSLGKCAFASSIDKISMDIYVDSSGNAHVTEVWDCRPTQGTEVYHPYYNLGRSEIKNLSVSEGSTVYTTLSSWNTSASLSSKANKCGINKISNGVELCWGIGDYSSHKYTVKYVITNFVAELSDSQMIYWTLIPYDFSNPIGSVYIKIYTDSPIADDIDVWGYGNYGGTCYVYDGYIEMQSDGKLDSDEYMTILAKFPLGTFNTSNVLNKDFNYYYNYDAATDKVLTAEDEGYIPYDYYDNELNKKTPLIIWSKNEKFEKQIDYYMGMIDVMPTIGNMFGIYNKYALGNDIFEIKDDNVIAFPNGNFLTNKVYYYNSKEEYKAINLNEVLSDEYIANAKNKADKLIDISNDIIVYDLIGVTSDERDKK